MHTLPELIEAEQLLAEGKHVESLSIVQEFLNKDTKNLKETDAIFSRYKAGCLLVDIGADLSDLALVQRGLEIIEDEKFIKYVTPHSREYNTGNAKKALFDIHARQPDRYSEEHLKFIIQAKNHYWRSLKQIPADDIDFRYQLLVNMANALDYCGRVTEALHLFTQALHINNIRFEAHACKASSLKRLHDLSEGYTAQLIFIMSHHYRAAIRYAPLPGQKASLKNRLESCRDALRRGGFNVGQYDRRHRLEYKSAVYQSLDFPAFCLNHGLFLSTHSSYCSCTAGQNDGLATRTEMLRMVKNRRFRDAVNLIHLFNRIVSEYVIGRRYLYQSQVPDVSFTPKMSLDSCIISAFRHTYGVFDKIAVALLIAHQIDYKSDELILFESFWRRKPKLREIVFSDKDFNLISLYSIATDLGGETGELRFFKEYRNILEHSTLVFTKKPIFSTKSGQLIKVSRDQIGQDLLAMTRLARSAIHSLFLHIKTQFPKSAE